MMEAGENICPTRLDVAGWIDKAWQLATLPTILNTWTQVMDAVRLTQIQLQS